MGGKSGHMNMKAKSQMIYHLNIRVFIFNYLVCELGKWAGNGNALK